MIEVGGAYAHRFFNLLDFLKLRTLIITDLDTINAADNRKKCKVSEGTHTSNACIKDWYNSSGNNNPTKDELLRKTKEEKISGNRRLAFQIVHAENGPCGRSFEDAFILANPDKFGIEEMTYPEQEEEAWNLAKKIDKTDFAMKYGIQNTDWMTPRYIEEGLRWLAIKDVQEVDSALEINAEEEKKD